MIDILATIASYSPASSAGDDAVPVLRHQLALHFHPLAERQRDVDVEALEHAGLVDVVERRIVSFAADAERGRYAGAGIRLAGGKPLM